MKKSNMKCLGFVVALMSASALNVANAYTLENTTSHLYFYKIANQDALIPLHPDQTINVPEDTFGETALTIYLRDTPGYDLDGYSIAGNGHVLLEADNVDINSGVFSITEHDDGTIFHGSMLVGQFFSNNGSRVGAATIPIGRK